MYKKTEIIAMFSFLLHFRLWPGLTQTELYNVLTKYDIKRLDMYAKNLVDYHLITDLLPAGKFSSCRPLFRIMWSQNISW